MKKWNDRTPTEKGMIILIIILLIDIIFRWNAMREGVETAIDRMLGDDTVTYTE